MDAVAINAGVGVGGLFVDTDLEKELNMIRLNCESTVHIARYAARKLVAQKDLPVSARSLLLDPRVGAEHFARLTEGEHPVTQDQMVWHQPSRT